MYLWPQVSTHELLWSFMDMLRVEKNLSHQTCMSPVEGGQGDPLPSWFSSYCKLVSSPALLGPLSFVFLLVMLLFQMVSKSNGNVLCGVPKCKKAVVCLRRNRVLEKLCSGPS